jgi:Ca2+-binding RTX toxin-like protein
MIPLLLMEYSAGTEEESESDAPQPNVLDGTVARDNIVGTAANDSITSLDDNDYVSGLGGDDVISLGAGNDDGLGGDGNDQIYGGDGSDVVAGGAGADYLRGGGGNDTVFDDNGADTLWGDLGDDLVDARDEPTGLPNSSDSLFGGYGLDTLIGDDGDTMSGGAWQDEFYVTQGGKPVVITDWEDGEQVTVTVPVGTREGVITTRDSADGLDLEMLYDDQVVAVLSGHAGADVLPHLLVDSYLPEDLIGTAENDILLGGAGNDVMVGFAGDDHVDSDGGDDTIYGGAGSDFVHTGGGNDLYVGHWAGHEAGPLVTDQDEVHASTGHDTLIADGGTAWLFGESGNDFLSSRDSAPEHKLTSDQLQGGIGQDTLLGDAGDTLTGGTGADSFQAYAESESVDAPVVVEDFDPLVDKLSLHLNYDAGLSTPGGQLTYEVDAALNRVVVSIDGVERLILGNTQCFDPRWVTLTMS